MADPVELSDAKRKLLERYRQGKSPAAPKGPAAIKRRSTGGAAPLSTAQQQIWVHSQLASGMPIYNEPMTIRRRGPLDIDVFERCFTEIVRRHETWRTRFDVVDGEPAQIAQPAPERLHFPFIDLRGIPEAAREAEALRLASEEARQPFDLRQAPVWRGTLMRLGEEDYRFYMSVHQIILDGVTAYRVLMPELVALYKAFYAGKPSPLPEPPVQYADFACWQRDTLKQGGLEEQMAYWRRQLGGELPALQWPNDHPRPAVQTYRGAMQPLDMPGSFVELLKAMCRQEGATLFMTMVAGLAALLHRYTGQEDIAVGTLTAARKRPEIEGLLGYFLNPLVLRTDVSGNPTFRELLARVRETVLGALTHEDVPFPELVKELQPDRDLSRNPLFQIMISLEPSFPGIDSGWDLTQADVTSGASKLDLYLDLDDRTDGIIGPVTYNPDLFEPDTITRMLGHWRTLLAAAAADPGQRIGELPLLTDAERRQFAQWNSTRQECPESCIHHFFEEQAAQNPTATALVFGTHQLSYEGLNRRANQLAHHLQRLGVGPETMVAVCLERSLEMVVALLAVLKAGGAYIPLDPSYPEERIAFMLEDAMPLVLLTQEALKGGFPDSAAKILSIDGDWDAVALEGIDNPVSLVKPTNAAYVIYTSGSTGKPKGVQVEHRSVVNFLTSMRREPGIQHQDTLLAVTTLSFDIAGLEIYLPLSTGAHLVIAGRDVAQDGKKLAALLSESGATIMQATPATWRLLVASGWQGSRKLKILCGGEALPPELAAELLARGESVWNIYGPTETTIWSAVYREHEGRHARPIGPPIANTEFYVLDGRGQQLPVGVAGELYIGGDGLARGYLNRPELTAAKFVPNIFSTRTGARLYRTGDLVRYLPDGNLEFLGRLDDQVKIRGFRIELGEIEAALAQHPGVRAAIATAHANANGDKSLVAYAVADPGQGPDTADLREFLRHKVPEYMVPSRFIFLDAFPLLPNGKVNRKALPSPEEAAMPNQEKFEAAGDALELQLVKIWETTLGASPIGIRDNFFELGGHSLLAARLLAEIEKAFGVTLSIASLFEAPTIAQLAGLLRTPEVDQKLVRVIPIQPVGKKAPLFCVCTGTGPMYLPLSKRLGTDQPFLGLDLQPSVIERLALPFTIEEIASHLVSAIREWQPEGPYFIAGHCINGLLAYETARQLSDQGRRVALLVMFQAQNPAPGADYSYGSQLSVLAKRLSPQHLRRHIITLRQMEMKETRDYLTDRVRNLALTLKGIAWQVSIPVRIRLAGERPHTLREVLFHAAKSYKPKPIPGPVALFRSTERWEEAFEDFHGGWRELVAEPVNVHEIPGKYWEIYREPRVDFLAEELRGHLLRAQGIDAEGEQIVTSSHSTGVLK